MTLTPSSVFAAAAKAGASDVHVAAGSPVLFRIDGVLEAQGKSALTASKAGQFVSSVLGTQAYRRFGEEWEIDVAYELSDGTRLRVNCHYERGNPSLVARIVPSEIPTLEDIDLKGDVILNLCRLPSGLILLAGPTGHGKSTSMAAMIQHIIGERPVHVVTLEDPIEFVFSCKQGLIRQREYMQDFHSFPEALKRVLRQDPNVVMVGEMRDLETVAAALTLAETGHLIFATLHTPSVVQAVDRIVDIFPPHQQNQIRLQASLALKAVIAQRLIPRKGGGRIAQREIMINTPAVSNTIRESRTQELSSIIQTNAGEGMVTYAQDAKRLLKAGAIEKEVYEWAVKGY